VADRLALTFGSKESGDAKKGHSKVSLETGAAAAAAAGFTSI
jgi:hypothetical protein